MRNVGTSAANIRVSNSVHYLYGITPNAHANGLSARGFYLQATAGMGENTANTASIGKSDGDYRGMRLGWQGGAVHVAAAYAETKNQLQSDYRVANIGASYRVGSVQLTSLYNRNKTGNDAIDNRTLLLGARIFMPTGTVRISYNHYKSSSLPTAGQKAQQLGLGYEHLLSKRTSVYGNFAYLKNSAGASLAVLGAPTASVNGRSRGLEIGMRHAF